MSRVDNQPRGRQSFDNLKPRLRQLKTNALHQEVVSLSRQSLSSVDGLVTFRSVIDTLSAGKRLTEIPVRGGTARPPQNLSELETAATVLDGILQAVTQCAVRGQIDLVKDSEIPQKKIKDTLTYWSTLAQRITSAGDKIATDTVVTQRRDRFFNAASPFLQLAEASSEEGFAQMFFAEQLFHPQLHAPASPEALHPHDTAVLMASPDIIATTLYNYGYHQALLAHDLYDPTVSRTTNIERIVQRGIDLEYKLDESKAPVRAIINEYTAIISALIQAQGSDNVFIAKPSHMDYMTQQIINRTLPRIHQLSEAVWQNAHDFPFQTGPANQTLFFIRDYYNLIGQFVFINRGGIVVQHPDVAGKHVLASSFSQGGQVLSPLEQATNKVVVVSASMKDTLGHRKLLQEQGNIVLTLSDVLPESQPAGSKQNFTRTHIDGHAMMVTAPDNTAWFLIAESYATQNAQTKQEVSTIRNYMPVMVIPDNATHLAFNTVQFENYRVVCPRGGSDESTVYQPSNLEIAIQDIVGNNNMIITDVPLVHIPEHQSGGIRCMTNTGNINLLRYLFAYIPTRRQ